MWEKAPALKNSNLDSLFAFRENFCKLEMWKWQWSEEFQPEAIIGKRKEINSVNYLIKWAHYDVDEATWEPHDDVIRKCPRLLEAYKYVFLNWRALEFFFNFRFELFKFSIRVFFNFQFKFSIRAFSIFNSSFQFELFQFSIRVFLFQFSI